MGGGAIGRGYRAGMPHLRPPRIADAKGAGQEDESAPAEGGERRGVRGGMNLLSKDVDVRGSSRATCEICLTVPNFKR